MYLGEALNRDEVLELENYLSRLRFMPPSLIESERRHQEKVISRIEQFVRRGDTTPGRARALSDARRKRDVCRLAECRAGQLARAA